MKTKLCLRTLFASALAGLATQAFAVTIVDLGYNAPPATLGGYTMMPAPDDLRATGGTVADAPLRAGASVTFSPGIEHFAVGDGWGTWSLQPGHNYTGDVYSLVGDYLKIGVPSGLQAFYFYVEPALFTTWSYTIASGGESLTLDIEGDPSAPGGGGARGFGVYIAPGDPISFVEITDNTGLELGFAVGEFGGARPTSVPESASLAMLLILGFAALAGACWTLDRN